MHKKEKARPTISTPTGPVWNSRGQALERGKQFSVVDEIEGWSGNTTPSTAARSDIPTSSATSITRRVSASFLNNERPSASPTVASSSLNATHNSQAPPSRPDTSRFLRRPSFPGFGKSKPARALIPASSTTSTLPSRAPVDNSKHIPRSTARNLAGDPSQTPAQVSKLPKSRTMGVLNELKSSFSRHNLNAGVDDAIQESVASQLPGPLPRFTRQSSPPAPQQASTSSRARPASSSQPRHFPAQSRRPVAVQDQRPSRAKTAPKSGVASGMLPTTHPIPVSPTVTQGYQTSRKLSRLSQHQSKSASDPSHCPSMPAASDPRHPSQKSQPSTESQHQSKVAREDLKRMSTGSSDTITTCLTLQPQPSQQQPGARFNGTPPGQSSLASAESSAQSPLATVVAVPDRSVTPEPTPAQITTAQPMQYWTGRLSGLTDYYMNQNRGPEMLLALQSGLMAQGRTWDSVKDIEEEDAIHLVIFARLEFLSSTAEAKKSLRDFQDYLARRQNRPMLLPPGAPPPQGGETTRSPGRHSRGAATSRRQPTGRGQPRNRKAGNPSS